MEPDNVSDQELASAIIKVLVPCPACKGLGYRELKEPPEVSKGKAACFFTIKRDGKEIVVESCKECSERWPMELGEGYQEKTITLKQALQVLVRKSEKGFLSEDSFTKQCDAGWQVKN